MIAPVPADGHAIVALLVGGNEDILRSLRSDLYDEFGIEIRNHWENARQFCPMPPKGTEAILVLRDFCSHTMSHEAKKIAKAGGARFVLIGRKKSAWLYALRVCGFVHKPSWRTKEPTKPTRTLERKEPTMTTEAPKNGTTVTPAAWTAPVAPAAPKPAAFNARIIEPPREWSERDMQTVIRLAEAWVPTNPPDSLLADAERFVDDVWRELGTYRTPAVLRLRVDALQAVINVRKDLLVALSRAAKRTHDAKVAHLKHEAEALKGPSSEWPPYITAEGVLSLVGKRNRFTGKPVFDRALGMLVYPRAEVAACKDALDARGVTADFTGSGLTEYEWETRILEILKAKGPCARGSFHLNGKASVRSRGIKALNMLVGTGAVLEAKHRGTSFYRLPEHPWPPAPRKLPPRAKKPAPAPLGGQFAAEFDRAAARKLAALDRPTAPKPAPHADTIKEARADVYRAMRAGEITAKDAAEILRQLAGGS